MNDLQYVKNAENTLLSSFYTDSTLLEDSNFKESFFYFSDNREIFNAMKILVKKGLPIDEDFIQKEIKNINNFNERWIEVITTMAVSNIENIEHELIEQYKKRELQKFLNRSISELNDTSSDKIINSLSNVSFNNINNSNWNFNDIQELKPEKPDFYLEDKCPIQKKEISLISSKGGKGKSFTALYLIGELAKLGLNCFGWFSEDDKGTTKNRFLTICKQNTHLSDANFKIFGKEKRLQSFIKIDRSGNYEASDFFLEFKKNMKPFDVVIIDPLVSLLCKDENNNIEVRFLMNLLNEWIEEENKTLIIIHHDGKGDNKSRGASTIVDSVRIHYSLQSIENNSTERKLVLEKANHYSGTKKEFIIKLFKNEIKPIEILFDTTKENKPHSKNKEQKEKPYNKENYDDFLGILETSFGD